MNHVKARALRGVRLVRADATDPKTLIEALNKAFAEFKTNHEEQIKEIKAGYTDVVKTEKVDKINAEVTKLQKSCDDIARQIAAIKVGPAGGKDTDPNKAAYATAFDKFFRRGVDANMGELAVKASLTTNSDPDGGYTIPEEMEKSIDRVLENASVMRQLATVRSISTSTYKKLITTSGAASGWVGETEARPETAGPKLSAIEINTMELYANPAASPALLDDSALDIAQWLADEVNMEFAEQEGDAFLNGDGNNKPRGLLNYDKIANASWAWGKIGYITSAGAADFAASNPGDRLIDLIYSLKRGYRNNATFLMNDLTISKVRKFKDGQGNYLWQPSVQVGSPASLLGKAVETDDFMPDVGANAYPVAFGDFKRAYMIVDRIGIRVLRDPFTNKPYVHFYTTKRVGGGVTNFQAVKLLKIETP
ncbi:phage major capsid protein [soil metagenome]